jgi:hypothetical protein
MTHHPHTAYLTHITREDGERIVRCMHPEHTMMGDANYCAFNRMWEIHSAVMVEGETIDGLTAEARVMKAIAEAKAQESADETVTRVHAKCHTIGAQCPTGLHVTGETHTPGFRMTTIYPTDVEGPLALRAEKEGSV